MKKLIVIFLLLYPAICNAQVSLADITVTSTSGNIVTTLTTPAMTITSNANVAGVIGLSFESNSTSSITASIGGASATVITGTDSGTTGTRRSIQFGVVAPPSGSQTATASWTTATDTVIGALTTSGVNQGGVNAGTFNNGTFNTIVSPNCSTATVTITSNSGDLTLDTVAETRTNTTSGLNTPTQTLQWNISTSGPSTAGAGSSGPGTGTTTHSWTPTLGSGAECNSSGVNFVQASGGGGATCGNLLLLGVGC